MCSERMDVVYFAKASEVGPSSRYRIFQYLPSFTTSGIRVTVKPLFSSRYFRLLGWRPTWVRTVAKVWYTAWRFLVRGVAVLSSLQADLIVLEGPLFPYTGLAVERWLSKRIPLVVELDDAIHLTPGMGETIPRLLQLSVGAIVGNQVLADYARSFTSQVHVIPTVVDTHRFAPTSPRSPIGTHPLTIGWMGLDYNIAYVKSLAQVLQKLQKDRSVRIKIICGTPPRFDGLNVDFYAWDYAREVEDLSGCDIGIMPLPDNEWTRGKCGLKLLQYMSLGIASVASPVGVNQKIIQHGRNGFLASTDDEWYETLLQLCDDAALRERVGREARKTVVEDYSLAVWAPRLISAYRTLSESSHVKTKVTTYPKAA